MEDFDPGPVRHGIRRFRYPSCPRWLQRVPGGSHTGPMLPETRYARAGDVYIAYQVSGKGRLDLVFVPGFVSHVEHAWEEPGLARFFGRLGAFSRLIRFDKRGTGLSDPISEIPTL